MQLRSRQWNLTCPLTYYEAYLLVCLLTCLLVDLSAFMEVYQTLRQRTRLPAGFRQRWPSTAQCRSRQG